MSDDWKKRIAIAFMVKQKIDELDVAGLWSLEYPELAASEAQIANAETAMNCKFPPDLRQFLSVANGWNQFYQRVDLFGTSDFEGSSRMARAQELVQWLIEDTSWGGTANELLPIAVSIDDNTLFCITTVANSQAGRVLWFSGRLIEDFANFTEFFLAMCDYNRLEVENLTEEHS
jgi:hypothetical protein